LDPYTEGQLSTLNPVKKTAAKFANNINESFDTARIVRHFQGTHRWRGVEGDKRQTSKTILSE
jgi:hypothetical protein